MDIETQATSEAMSICMSAQNAVLDTPGSVIYVSMDVLAALKEEFFLVYLEANNDDIERLKQLYFSHPKPLIWKDCFEQLEGEDYEGAISRSYPKLLALRAKLYAEIADFTLPAQSLYNGSTRPKAALGL